MLRLAFMALARFESIASLRYTAPGEWGNLLGLDRVPEVRTLRAKIQLLAQGDAPGQWSAAPCERWMAPAPEQAGVFYIDGHVRVYNGSQTQLPRHYRLLGQRHGRATLICRQPGARPGADCGHRAADRTAPGATSA